MTMTGITMLAGAWAALGAFAVKAVIVMVLIALAAVATPYIAKAVDKHGKRKTPDENPEDEHNSDVRGIFEASHDEDFDPNYKIYNTDIYGINRNKQFGDEKKHGKKQ